MHFQSQTMGSGHGPSLLIIAGVHGDEFEPMMAVRQLAKLLQKTEVQGRITLIPIVNQPAFLRGQRTADDNRDLARTMPGCDAGSITEQIAAQLTPFIQQADYLIDLHTGGRMYRILPLSGYVLHTRADVLQRQRAMSRAFGLPMIWGTNPNLEGRTLSVARDANVPAIYVEACGGESFSLSAVTACVQGCLNVAAMLGMTAATTSALPQIDWHVEDPRDQSGHLQLQHPSPVDGYFEPLANLGQTLDQGELLGRIVDPFGVVLAEIPASEPGVVLFQRAIPSIKQGESIGGMLPISYRWSDCTCRTDTSLH